MDTADSLDETTDLSSKKRVRSAQLSQLTKLYNELERSMSSYQNKDFVKSLYGKLNDRFEQFRSAHLQCLDLCTESDAAKTWNRILIAVRRTSSSSRTGFLSGLRKEKGLHLMIMTVVHMSAAQPRVRLFRHRIDYGLQRLGDLYQN